MAQLGLAQRNVADVDTSDNFSPIPEGEYSFQIVNSEVKEGKSSGVPNLLLMLRVIEGNFKGREVRHRLNLWSANATAVNISEGELGQLCEVFGMAQFPGDSAELHGKPFNALVKIKQDEGYEPSNEIKTKSFRPYAQVGGAAPVAQAPTAPTPPPVAASAPPQAAPAPAPAPAPAAGSAPPDWTQKATF